MIGCSFSVRIYGSVRSLRISVRPAMFGYFHPSFHFSLSRSLHYVGENYGATGVREVISRYVQHAVLPFLDTVNLAAIEEKILSDYKKEHCPDAVTTKRTEKGLSVTVDYCPAIRYLTEHNMWVSPWFSYSTQGVMEELAQAAGCKFTMLSYDEATGASTYEFTKP